MTEPHYKKALPKDKDACHYDVGGVEVIEVIRAKLTEEQFTGFLLGNVIKYALRANHKGCFGSDIGKISVYTKMLAAVMPQD